MVKTTQAIGLWLDTTSDAPHEGGTWIVSRDRLDEQGGAEDTRTIRTFATGEYQAARAFALETGEREGLPVIEMDEAGRSEQIYAGR